MFKKFMALFLAFVFVFSLGISAFAETPINTEANLVSAISTVATGETIVLADDITLTSTLIIPAGKNFTLDLNDFNIYLDATGTAIKVENGAEIVFDSVSYGESYISSKNGVAIENYGTVEQNKVIFYSDTDYALKNSGIYSLYTSGIIVEGTEKAAFYNEGEFYQYGSQVVNGEVYDENVESYKGFVFEMDNTAHPDALIKVYSGDMIGFVGDYYGKGKATNVELISGHFRFYTDISGGGSFGDYISGDAEAYVFEGSEMYMFERHGYPVTHLFDDFQEALDFVIENQDFYDSSNVHLEKKLTDTYYLNGEIKNLSIIGYPDITNIPTIKAKNGYKIEFDTDEYSVLVTVTKKESSADPIIIGEKSEKAEKSEENPNTGAPALNIIPAMAVLCGMAFVLKRKH